MMTDTTIAPDEAHTQEALTEWYESRTAEGDKPTVPEFVRANREQEHPLDTHEAQSLYFGLLRRNKKSLLGRIPLGEALRDGVPEPEELEQDVLIKGAAHHVFTGAENGKTWVALWLVKRAIGREQTVMYMDMENGLRIITERLQELGVDHDAANYLHYYYLPPHGIDPQSVAMYEAELDIADPTLIVFDSWIGFLAACGLNEDSNTDVERWANLYIQSAKERGCTVLILDHIPHNAKRSRGASRKRDFADVQWRLEKIKPFNRECVGYVQLNREKDRESWLPQRVGFSIGGTEHGFTMKRSAGTVDDPGDGLTGSERAALDALENFGDAGAKYAEWRKATPWKGGEMPDTTFRRARNKLIDPDLNRVIQNDDRYFHYSHYSQSTATAVMAVGHNGTATTATPLRVAVAAVDDGEEDWWNEEPPF